MLVINGHVLVVPFRIIHFVHQLGVLIHHFHGQIVRVPNEIENLLYNNFVCLYSTRYIVRNCISLSDNLCVAKSTSLEIYIYV